MGPGQLSVAETDLGVLEKRLPDTLIVDNRPVKYIVQEKAFHRARS